MSVGQRLRPAVIAIAAATVLAATASACSGAAPRAPDSHPAPAPAPVPAPPPVHHIVAFIGDSYTETPDGSPPYWLTTASKMCWYASAFGAAGTGYTVYGPDGRGPYWTRLDAVGAIHPDIVVVQGSFNDVEPAAVTNAATALFKAIHQRFPAANLLVMGPVTPAIRPVVPKVALLDDAIKAAAESNYGVYIDATNFLTDPSLFGPDQIHPNAQGHVVLGSELANAVPTQLSSCPK